MAARGAAPPAGPARACACVHARARVCEVCRWGEGAALPVAHLRGASIGGHTTGTTHASGRLTRACVQRACAPCMEGRASVQAHHHWRAPRLLRHTRQPPTLSLLGKNCCSERLIRLPLPPAPSSACVHPPLHLVLAAREMLVTHPFDEPGLLLTRNEVMAHLLTGIKACRQCHSAGSASRDGRAGEERGACRRVQAHARTHSCAHTRAHARRCTRAKEHACTHAST